MPRGLGFSFDDIGALKQGIGDVPVEHLLRQYSSQRDALSPTDFGLQIVAIVSSSVAQTIPHNSFTDFVWGASTVQADPFHMVDSGGSPDAIEVQKGLEGFYMGWASGTFTGNATGVRVIRWRRTPAGGAAGAWLPADNRVTTFPTGTAIPGLQVFDAGFLRVGDRIQPQVLQSSGGDLDLATKNVIVVRFGSLQGGGVQT